MINRIDFWREIIEREKRLGYSEPPKYFQWRNEIWGFDERTAKEEKVEIENKRFNQKTEDVNFGLWQRVDESNEKINRKLNRWNFFGGLFEEERIEEENSRFNWMRNFPRLSTVYGEQSTIFNWESPRVTSDKRRFSSDLEYWMFDFRKSWLEERVDKKARISNLLLRSSMQKKVKAVKRGDKENRRELQFWNIIIKILHRESGSICERNPSFDLRQEWKESVDVEENRRHNQERDLRETSEQLERVEEKVERSKNLNFAEGKADEKSGKVDKPDKGNRRFNRRIVNWVKKKMLNVLYAESAEKTVILLREAVEEIRRYLCTRGYFWPRPWAREFWVCTPATGIGRGDLKNSLTTGVTKEIRRNSSLPAGDLGDHTAQTDATERSYTSAMANSTTEAVGEVKYLYIHTPFFLYQLEVKNHISNEFSIMSELPPPPTIAITYKCESYPVGMGLAKSESGIYMLGGEYIDAKEGYVTNCSSKVFKFQPGENRLTESEPSMKSAKTLPLVETIAGEIYVLPTLSLFGTPLSLPSTHSPFEILDTSSADSNTGWEELPCPPFYSADHGVDSVVSSHFVLGHKLYVLTQANKLYYFDTSRGCWGIEEDMFKYWCSESNCMPPMLIPIGGRMVSEDVILALKEDLDDDNYPALGPTLKLNAYFYSKDGHLLAYQNLGDVFPVKLYVYSHHLIAMENAKFCALTVGSNPEIPISINRNMGSVQSPRKVLAVSIFSVKKLKQEDAIQAKVAMKHPPLASVDIMDVSSASVVPQMEEQDKIFSLNIEKQYIFPVGETGFLLQGAFFA